MDSENNPDGTIKWISKKFNTEVVANTTTTLYPFSFNNLYSCNIETNVVKESIKISGIEESAVIMLDQITGFTLSNNIITISTDGLYNYYLSFVSSDEAFKAYNNIDLAIAGEDIVCPGNLITTKFSLSQYNPTQPITSISYPAIIFIDDLDPIEVTSKSNLVSVLNTLADSEYSVSNNSDPWAVTFTYQLHKTPYLPKVIKILTRKINLSVTGLQLQLLMNLNNEKFFVIENGIEVKPENNLYTFSTENEKTVKIYFIENDCLDFEISLATQVKFNHTSAFKTLTTNSPNIKRFKSTGIILFGLSELFSNSTNLTDVTLINNGAELPDFSLYPIKNLTIDNSLTVSANTLNLPQSLINLNLNNVAISALNISSPSLNKVQLDNCFGLVTFNLTAPNLQTLSIQNTSINSFSVISSLLKDFKMINSKLTTLTLATNQLLYNIDISYNDLMDVTNYNLFLSDLIANNIVYGGNITLKTNDNLVLDNSLLSELKRKNWIVNI